MAKIVQVKYYNTLIVKSATKEWHVEESRIKGGFNNKSMDYGVRAHIVDKDYNQQTRTNTLIYSGIYNNRTAVNNTNQFPVDKPITLSVDIQQGGIYKLFAEDQLLNIFQEEKVRYVPINKDIIYTAEGVPLSTSSNVFLGDVVSYGTNYGIGKNPESFAYYAGRKYFVDKPKGAVLRLSRDGITEISNYGMRSYFRDNLRTSTTVLGAWDMYNKDYVISLQGGSENITLTFDESVNGWTSKHSYIPQLAGSLDGKFYTFKNCDIYEHYANSEYNKFYGTNYNSEIDFIFNQEPSINKNFVTINYEGTNTWNISNIETDIDSAENIISYDNTKQDTDTDMYLNIFRNFDGKYHANIINNSTVENNEISFGGDISGVKGYFAKMKIKTSATTYQELFSVSTNFNINSY